jgi:hypothetical protein
VVPTPYPTIQSAIDAALDGDTVLVLEGTYYEQIRFRGKAITVTSLYVLDHDAGHVERTVIDGSQLTDSDSLTVVYFIDGEDTTSVLMGFTVQAGRGTYLVTYSETAGGGVLAYGSGAKLAHNIISNNTVTSGSTTNTEGAGIMVFGAAAPRSWIVLEGNTVRGNRAEAFSSNASNAWGAGCSIANSHGRILENLFLENTADANRSVWGGGLGLWMTGEVDVMRNEFRDNDVHSEGMSAGWATSAALGIDDETYGNGGVKRVTDNIFALNDVSCENGYAYGGVGQPYNVDLLFARNRCEDNTVHGRGTSSGGALELGYTVARIENNLFVRNVAVDYGYAGAIALRAGSHAEIVNNTIVFNSSSSIAGGLYVGQGTHAYTFNDIFWGNTAPTPQGGPQIYVAVGGIAYVRYSDVEGGFTGEGNIDADPRFADDTYELLMADSPCIWEGGIGEIELGGEMYYAPTNDCHGHVRPQPAGSTPDMGAEESWLGLTDVADHGGIPSHYQLYQNYPNPFNPATTISFDLPERTDVQIALYNVLGQQVRLLAQGEYEAGPHTVSVDASRLASGVYMYRLQAGSYVEARKMTVMR